MNNDFLDDLLAKSDARLVVGTPLVLVLIIALAALLYGVKPAMAEYEKLRFKHDAALAGPLPEGSARSASIARIESEVGAMREEFYGGAVGIPRRQLESFIVNALDRTATEHAVDLMGITPAAASSIWMFDELPYQVRVRGEYFSLHRWLFDLESELRPMVIKHFKLVPTPQSDRVMLDLRVVAYRASGEDGA